MKKGPLAGLNLGNGLAETRGFTGQYFPERIEMPGRLLQSYTTDPVGNILGITRTVGTQSYSMAFAYQDPQYFLTQGNGPWGQQSWIYPSHPEPLAAPSWIGPLRGTRAP